MVEAHSVRRQANTNTLSRKGAADRHGFSFPAVKAREQGRRLPGERKPGCPLPGPHPASKNRSTAFLVARSLGLRGINSVGQAIGLAVLDLLGDLLSDRSPAKKSDREILSLLAGGQGGREPPRLQAASAPGAARRVVAVLGSNFCAAGGFGGLGRGRGCSR